MENSKRKFWAREILIFWVSLLATVVIYLLFVAGASISDYFRNKEIRASNQRVREAIAGEQALIDSLKKVPQFISSPLEKEENKEKRRVVFEVIAKDGLYSKSFSDFKAQFCCNHEKQLKFYNLLSSDYDVGTFDEFQKKLFGDYINPEWEESKKKIEQHKSKKRSLELELRGDIKTHIHLEIFALVWFAITYPLRGIVFSILWALRTVKEK